MSNHQIAHDGQSERPGPARSSPTDSEHRPTTADSRAGRDPAMAARSAGSHGRVPRERSFAQLAVGHARQLLRDQIVSLGDRLIEWRTDRSLRFSRADRFGHELPDRKELLRRAWHYARFNGIDGDYAEFGCHGAHTFRMAWHAMDLVGATGHLWGFDSFAGLPGPLDQRDAHPQWVPGTMATPVEQFQRLCARAGVPPDRYSMVEGLYHETLSSHGIGPRPQSVAVAYVDCDLYSSTVEVLRFLETRLRPGAVLAFDDYFCTNPDGPSGERRAALEHFASSTWQLVPYVQFGWAGLSFVVEQRDDRASGPLIVEDLRARGQRA